MEAVELQLRKAHVEQVQTCSGHSAMAGALRWGTGRWRGAPRGADWDLPLGAAGIVRLQALLRASSTASCMQVQKLRNYSPRFLLGEERVYLCVRSR